MHIFMPFSKQGNIIQNKDIGKKSDTGIKRTAEVTCRTSAVHIPHPALRTYSLPADFIPGRTLGLDTKNGVSILLHLQLSPNLHTAL